MTTRKNTELNRKLVSVWLIIGGGIGVAAFFWTVAMLLTQGFSGSGGAVALLGLFALIFGITMWTGIALWRKKPWAFRCSQILLIAQIPNLTVVGFSYHFYTGLALFLSLSRRPDIFTGFEFELGSALKFQFSTEAEGFVCGINLVAVVALYLLGKARL